MTRILAFIALLAIFVVVTFPHRMIVERMLSARLANTGVEISIEEVSPRLPLGYKLLGVDVGTDTYSTKLDEIRLGLGLFSRRLKFSAAGCGGELSGSIDRNKKGRRLFVEFSQIDPSSCARLDSLVVGGTIDGKLELEGLGTGRRGGVLGRTAATGTLAMDAKAGTVSGHLPSRTPASSDGTPSGIPIGSWEYDNAHLEAHVDQGKDVVVDAFEAQAEGVDWRIASARLVGGQPGRVGINADMRARRLDDSGRSKAIIGLLPKAGENNDGWRRYRISGTLDAPKIIGLR